MTKRYGRRKFGPRRRYAKQEQGLWAAQGHKCLYTGTLIDDIDNLWEMDVDHVVPLFWAWEHGADRWSWWKRRRFAADGLNLAVVTARVNREKGDKGFDEWRPDVNKDDYRHRWFLVCAKYGLPQPGYKT